MNVELQVLKVVFYFGLCESFDANYWFAKRSWVVPVFEFVTYFLGTQGAGYQTNQRRPTLGQAACHKLFKTAPYVQKTHR